MVVSDKEIDRIMGELGGYSRWQMMVYFSVMILLVCPYAFTMLITVFIGTASSHHCIVPNNVSIATHIPWNNETNSFSSCMIYDDNSEVPCTEGWSYEESKHLTIANEFDLVCDRTYLSGLVHTLFVSGSLTGAFAFTRLADIFGRKPVFVTSMVLTAVVLTLASLSQSITSYLAVRFLAGTLIQGCQSGFTYSMEMFSAKHRTFAGMSLEYVWCGCMLVIVGLAYGIRNWRLLQLICGLPGLLAVVLYWAIPESVPWLLTNGRIEDAKQAIKRIARFNKVEIPKIRDDSSEIEQSQSLDLVKKEHVGYDVDCLLSDKYSDQLGILGEVLRRSSQNLFIGRLGGSRANVLDQRSSENQNFDAENVDTGKEDNEEIVNGGTGPLSDKSFFSRVSTLIANTKGQIQSYSANRRKADNAKTVLKSRRMVRICLCTSYIWFTNAFVYWGLLLSVKKIFPGDLYVNFILTTFAELAAYIFVHIVLRYVGRRKPVVIFHLITGLSLLAAVFTPKTTSDGQSLQPLVIAFGLVCRFGISASFAGIYLYSPEVFPTNFRTTGLGMSIASAFAGSLIAPYFTMLSVFAEWLPGTAIACLALIAGVVCWLLPETRNRPLPETVRDVENLYT